MKTPLSVFVAAFLSAALPVAAVFAQTPPQAAASRPAASKTPWDLHAPVEGRPCPSQVEKFEAPAELLFGTYDLDPARGVVDGDTLRVTFKEPEPQRSLRLIGLDCEETFKDKAKRKLAEKDWGEYKKTELAGHDPKRPPKYATFLGEAAKDAAQRMLAGVKRVRLEWDEPARKIDGFDRHLVVVLYERDGRRWNFNVEMVRQGLSPYFVKYGRSQRWHAAFEAAQKEAQEFKRGIWDGACKYAHYGDYAVRLAWWAERDAAQAEAAELRKSRDDLYILGRAEDWERLKAAVGKRVTVVGAAGEPLRKGANLLWAFSHAKNEDFVIFGASAEVEKLGPAAENGNLLYLTGVVENFNGKPQFKAGGPDTIVVSRRPPAKP